MTSLEDNTALELPVRVILAEFVILFDAYVKDPADMNFGPLSVLPNPCPPLSVARGFCTHTMGSRIETRSRMSCAILSPFLMRKSLCEWLKITTLISPV